MEIEIFTVNGLGKDFGNYKTRFPKAWERYMNAYEVIVSTRKESILGAAFVTVTEPSGFICCNHFYPGVHGTIFDYFTDRSVNPANASSDIYPKYITDNEFGTPRIVRYVDYEAYFKAISKIVEGVGELNRYHGTEIDKVKILWSVDGNLKIIEEINKEVLELYKSNLEIEICLESQYWPESL